MMLAEGGFDPGYVGKIEGFYPRSKGIIVTEPDALRFACNAINIDRTIILNNISRELSDQLESKGFHVVQVPLTEFLKAGGAAKSLVMRLSARNATFPQHARAIPGKINRPKIKVPPYASTPRNFAACH